MSKKTLISSINEVKEITKDFNKFVHLFAKDEGVKTMAKLRELVHKIEFELNLSEIKEVAHPQGKALIDPRGHKKGCYVKVRPCEEKFENKTYLGFLIGDIALSSSVTIEGDKIVCNWSMYNPLIFIPTLGDTVTGSNSWWSEIKTIEDLKDISDNDIESVWYVRALQQISS